MNEKELAQKLIADGYKLWRYSYTIHHEFGGNHNLVVTGYLWNTKKPSVYEILGWKSEDKTISYILEVEYTGQDLSQRIKSA